MSTVDDADQELPEDAPSHRPPRALLIASSLGMVLALVVLGVLLLWLMNNDPSLLRKSLGPLLMSMLFLLLGFSTIGVMKAFFPDFNVHGDVLFITVLVVPVIAYLLLAGQVSSLNVSGVLEANFLQEDLNQLLPPSATLSQELLTNLDPLSSGTDLQAGTETETEAGACAARTPTPTAADSSDAPLAQGAPTAAPPPMATTAPYVNPVYRQTIQNPPSAGSRPVEATQAPMDIVVAGKSVYLPLEIGQRYEAAALSSQVARLAQSDAFKFVVFVMNCRFLVADIPAAAAPEVFRQQADALVTAIEDGPGALRDPGQFPALGYDTIRASDSAQMALDTMSERNIDALIEVDASGNIVKVITREQIESALIQELVTRTAQ